MMLCSLMPMAKLVTLRSALLRACFLLVLLPGTTAWRAHAPRPRSNLLAAARRGAVPLLCDTGGSESDQTLFASLRARQQTLEDELSERWREAKCASKVPVALTDSWVRRVAVSWPQVAIGPAARVKCTLARKCILARSRPSSHTLAHGGRVWA